MRAGDSALDLPVIQGREQAGSRYVLIVSLKTFNVLGTPLVCPITQGGNFARHAGFARKARFIEKVPDFIIDEVLAKLATLIE